MLVNKLNTLRDQSDEEGFTLIELMIVVVIIGILAAIAIPIFANQQKESIKATAKSDVKNTNTNLSTALAKNPTATGFVTYKNGEAVPTLAAGQVAVQVTASDGNVVKITDVVTGDPTTATGDGSWDSYEITVTNPSLSGYYYTFKSTTGKYTDGEDGANTGGTSGAGGGGGTTPSEPIASGTVISSANFASSPDGWAGAGYGETVALGDQGGSAAKVTVGQWQSQMGISKMVATEEGANYSYEARVFIPADSTGNMLSVHDGSRFPTKGSWQWVSGSVDSSGTQTEFWFVLKSNGDFPAGSIFYVDDIQITKN